MGKTKENVVYATWCQSYGLFFWAVLYYHNNALSIFWFSVVRKSDKSNINDNAFEQDI